MIQTADSFDMLKKLVNKGTVLVDYGAPWCPPCKALLPILEELDSEMKNRLRIVKVNCDDLPDAASEAGVMSMPTVVIYKDGQPMDKFVGLRPIATYRQAVKKQL